MYSLKLSPAAVRDYKKLPANKIENVNRGIENISGSPGLSGYKKLKNRNACRIRVNDYRIIYEIPEKSSTIVYYPRKTQERGL
jgi:mRNA interferase RelE/StbE